MFLYKVIKSSCRILYFFSLSIEMLDASNWCINYQTWTENNFFWRNCICCRLQQCRFKGNLSIGCETWELAVLKSLLRKLSRESEFWGIVLWIYYWEFSIESNFLHYKNVVLILLCPVLSKLKSGSSQMAPWRSNPINFISRDFSSLSVSFSNRISVSISVWHPHQLNQADLFPF